LSVGHAKFGERAGVVKKSVGCLKKGSGGREKRARDRMSSSEPTKRSINRGATGSLDEPPSLITKHKGKTGGLSIIERVVGRNQDTTPGG